jgi:broad specificity phosphatase PhoE
MSIIYLVRHGQGSFGTDNYDKLSPLGREQSQLLGAHFREIGERIDHVYTGNLERQRETAELLAEGLGGERPPITIDSAFAEYEGDVILRHYAATLSQEQLAELGYPALLLDRRKFQLFLEQAARAWVEARIAADDLLSWTAFRGRIIAALERIMRDEGRSKTLVISTSGGVIGTIVAHVLGLANHVGIELNWAVHNASITRLIYSESKVSLSMFNALPHFERDGRKRFVTYR